MPATITHPRPQLTRSRWIDLGGHWGFAHDDDDVGRRQQWHRAGPGRFPKSIVVPYPPESPASGIADTERHEVVWYRREVQIPADHDGRWLLHFGAVDYLADVWVNGSLVASHAGGHTPFTADITSAFTGSASQIITVRAEDRPDLTQPRGKQHWGEPEEIWYHRTTGIWQPVWLEPVPDVHITAVRWTPDLAALRVRLEVSVSVREADGLQLRVELTRDGGSLLADDTYLMIDGGVRRDIAVDISAPSLARRRELVWSPEHPNLINATLTLLLGDVVVDSVSSYLGLRSAEVRGGAFVLNGLPCYLRLVLAQGYWPDTHLAAADDHALRREVELIKALGFNGVRVHQKIEDPRFLYWCDRLGLLVWTEMPSHYVFHPQAVARTTREWLEVLERDHSHPCIVTWVCANESWGVDALGHDESQRAYIRCLYELTRAMDGTRPVIANDGWEYVAGEFLGIHDYAHEVDTLRARYEDLQSLRRTVDEVQPNSHPIALPGALGSTLPAIVLSEFGGIAGRPHDQQAWFGYGTVADAEELLATYTELVGVVLESSALAGFCYTQLTDTGQEINGLADARREPKVDPVLIRAANRRPTRSIPGELLLSKILDAADVSVRTEPGEE